MQHLIFISHLNYTLEIVCCWNNCSGYSQEKCFKCNLVFPKLSRLKKGQQVKGFWSQGRKKGTEGKVFEAEAVGWGWEMFPEVPFYLPRLRNVYELPFFFSTKMPWDKPNYTRIIFFVEFKPEQLFQQDIFLDFLVFLWTFWPLLRIKET